MAKKRKTPRFGGNAARTAEKSKRQGKSFGYFTMPKDMKLYKERVTKARERLLVDVIPYLVTDEKHWDNDTRDPEDTNATKDTYWYRRPVLIHRNVGAEKERVICPRTWGGKCPICEHRKQQLDNGVDKKEAEPNPQLRILYAVIPLGDKNYDEEVHIWEIAAGNFQEADAGLDQELLEQPDYGEFYYLEDGYTLSMRFSEDSYAGNKYAYCTKVTFKEREEDYDESILDDVPNLDDLLIRFTYDELKAKYYELDEGEGGEEPIVDEEPEEEEEEDTPPRKKKTTGKKKPRKVEKEPEPEEEEEDEPEPHKPKRGKVKRSAKKKPEPEEEEEGEEKCPYGHVFGEDWDEYDDCGDCELYEECGKENEQIEQT